MNLSRRHLLKLGGAALAGASVTPTIVRAQSPKRGGTLAIRTYDPPHFDPFQTISYKTHIALSFTHSRLLKHKAGPGVVPGTFPIRATWPSRGRSRTTRRTSSSSAAASGGPTSRRSTDASSPPRTWCSA
jgi:hypothetical protein